MLIVVMGDLHGSCPGRGLDADTTPLFYADQLDQGGVKTEASRLAISSRGAVG
jgi:hypothetical protein